jgi:hypothetical protein
VFKTTDGDDTIIAISSSLSSARTLNPTDQIDGGAGKDTLKVSLDSAFNGFTGTGKLVNVETLELSTAGSIARNFDATGATGIETVKVDGANGAISVTDLAALAAVELTGQKSGNFSVAYDAKSVVVTGTQKDAQALTLTNVGTAEVPAAGTVAKVAAKHVNVTVANVESSVVTSAGTANYVNLAGVAGTSVVVNGAADIGIQAVNAAVTSFDATAATGKVTVDLNGVTPNSLKSIATGSGDDKVTVGVSSLTANAEINGGAGTDTLVLKTSGTGVVTLQPTLAGFETVEVGGTGTGALTISAKNSSDLSNLVIDGISGAVSLVNTTVADLKLTSKGAETAQTVTADNAGSTTLDFVADAATVKAATTADANAMITTLSKSSELTVNVGSYVAASGAINAGKAQNVALNVGTGLNAAKTELTSFSGKISASTAQSFTVKADGALTGAEIEAGAATSGSILTGKTASTLIVDTAKLEQLAINAGGGLVIDAGSNLGKVQQLTASTEGVLSFNASAALTVANNVTVAGTNNASKAVFNAIGNGALDYNLGVTASGLKAGLETGAINGGVANATVDVSGVTGTVKIASVTAGKVASVNANGTLGLVALAAVTGETVEVNGKSALVGLTGALVDTAAGATAIALNASKAATFVGSEFANNKATVTATAGSTDLAVSLTGGLENDEFVVNGAVSSTSIKVTGNGDLGTTNTLAINSGINVAAQTIDASGVTNLAVTIDATLSGVGGINTIIGSAGNDIILGGTKGDTITGGKGADDITLGTAGVKDTVVIATGDTGITAATADKITTFTTKEDVLKLGVAGSLTNYAEATATAAGFDAIKLAADAAMDGTVKYYFGFEATKEGYLFIDRDMDGTADEAVILVGVNTAGGFEFGDIVA